MNWKRLWLTALLVYIVLVITELIIHVGILGGYYSRMMADSVYGNVFRSDAEMAKYMWVMYVTGAVYSFFFAFIFAKGYEDRGIAEGIRYGIYIGLFFIYVGAFNEFVIFRMPYGLAWIWIIAGLVQSVILGIVAALVYKPTRAPAVAVGG